MVAQDHPLPVTRRCELLDLPRSTFYHTPQGDSAKDLELMKLIDRCHLTYPFYGSRRIRTPCSSLRARSTLSPGCRCLQPQMRAGCDPDSTNCTRPLPSS
jgi:hypothetical protein